jgi:predicted GNAT superfamily acetyltransferase
MGLGTRAYKYLDEVAAKESLPICCEVNSDPPNDISIKFHIKNGFKKIGKKEFADHSVIYFIK